MYIQKEKEMVEMNFEAVSERWFEKLLKLVWDIL